MGHLATDISGVYPVTMVSRRTINTLEPIAKTARKRVCKSGKQLLISGGVTDETHSNAAVMGNGGVSLTTVHQLCEIA